MKNDFIPILPEMLEEFGVSVECLVYALIGRFSKLNGGDGLYISKNAIAKKLHCSKSAVCAALVQLLSKTDETGNPQPQYILATPQTNDDGGAGATVYEINTAHPLSRIWTTPVQYLDNPCPESGQPPVQNLDEPCPEFGQPTIREKKKRKGKRSEREPQAASPTLDFISISEFPHVRLTAEQYERLKFGFDLKQAKGKTLHHYLTLLESQIVNNGKEYADHYLKICEWMTGDGAIQLDEDKMQRNKDADIAIAMLTNEANGFAAEQLTQDEENEFMELWERYPGHKRTGLDDVKTKEKRAVIEAERKDGIVSYVLDLYLYRAQKKYGSYDYIFSASKFFKWEWKPLAEEIRKEWEMQKKKERGLE